MKILHLSHRYWPARGGAERYMQEISERLVRDGHEVTVYTTDAYDIELFWKRGARRVRALNEVHNGVQIRRFPVRQLPLHFPLALALALLPNRQLKLLLRPPSPLVPSLFGAAPPPFDVVHTTSLPYTSILWAGYRQARKSGARLICTPHVHIGEPGSNAMTHHFARPEQLWLVDQSDTVIVHTEREAAFLTCHGIGRERIRVIGAGINPSELEGGSGSRFRSKHSFAPDEPLVLTLGTRAFDKGTTHLVGAMQRLWANGIRATLVLAGSSQPDFHRFWRTVSPETRARTLVFDDISDSDKRDVLAASQVLAMPSRSDTFGIVFLEAWAYGLPVIGANAGGIPDVITHEQDGLIVPFADVPALARSLGRLLADAAERDRLGQAGGQKMLAQWTWDKVFEQVRPLYACP